MKINPVCPCCFSTTVGKRPDGTYLCKYCDVEFSKEEAPHFPIGLADIMGVCYLILHEQTGFSDANQDVARRRKRTDPTIIDACARRIGLTTPEFIQLLQFDTPQLITYLVEHFREYEADIRKAFRRFNDGK